MHVTKEVSKSTTPRVHEVIPFIDRLNDALDDFASDVSLPPTLRVAAARGSMVLNKYYSKTDDSVVFRIAMSKCFFNLKILNLICTRIVVLHPSYKLEYFRTQRWEPEWISMAERIIREEWNEGYKPKEVEGSGIASEPTVSHSFTLIFITELLRLQGSMCDKYFSSITCKSNTDALSAYLASPAIPGISDPLHYWNTMGPETNALA